jgi:hypothetical protein
MSAENPTAGAVAAPPLERFRYDDAIVRKFLFASLAWGAVGMLVGLIVALQLAEPWFNSLGLPAEWAQYFSFGRLRPLHTNAVIFAFAGNGIFAAVYYSTQRLLKTRMFSDKLGKAHFWGWQGIILAAAITLPMGYTQGKEYAELEWLLRHAEGAPRAPHLCGDLVLHRNHHCDRRPAYLQQPVGHRRPSEELLGLRRSTGRLHAVVVWPQRGGILPDLALPGLDVLLPAEGSGAAGF